jgi:hypothetical protein
MDKSENDSDLFLLSEFADARKPWSRKKALEHEKRKGKPRRRNRRNLGRQRPAG